MSKKTNITVGDTVLLKDTVLTRNLGIHGLECRVEEINGKDLVVSTDHFGKVEKFDISKRDVVTKE